MRVDMAVPGKKTRMPLTCRVARGSDSALECDSEPCDLTRVSLHGIFKARFSGRGRRHNVGRHIFPVYDLELGLMEVHGVGILEIIHFPDLGCSYRGSFGDSGVPWQGVAGSASSDGTIAKVIVEKAHLARPGRSVHRFATAVGKIIRRGAR